MAGTRRQGRYAPAHARRERGGTTLHDAGTTDAADPARAGRAVALGGPGAALTTVDAQPVQVTQPVQATRPVQVTQPLQAMRALQPTENETLVDAPLRVAGTSRRGRALLRGVVHRDRALRVGGAELRLLVLACTPEGTAAVDLASGSLVRLRIPWPPGHAPDLAPFDVVEATLADDPECDDLAQPEAATVAEPPRQIGSLHGRRVRSMLSRLATTRDDPLLGFHGPSAPYWDFHGLRPSVALIRPTRGPQLLRRSADGSTWVRFGWQRDDVWLPVEDGRAVRALAASRRDRLATKPLATALGFSPHYLLVALSGPRAGHCYKVCAAILPKG